MALQGAPAARLAQSISSSGDASCALTSSSHSSVTVSSSLSFPATGYSHVCAHSGASLSKKSLDKWRPFSGTRIASAGTSRSFDRRRTNIGVSRAEVETDVGAFGDQSKDFIPHVDFYKVEAVLRPWRLTPVSSALIKMGIRGVTVTDVRGFGAQGGSRERQAGTEYAGDSFLTKVKLEIVVSHEQVEAVIDTIIDQARTGEIGDGKIFVSPVSDVIRIRTGERGLKAERMAGGRADMQVSVDGTDGV